MPKKLETLEEELKRWKTINDHLNSKYAHVPAMGEKVIYKKDQVTRMTAKLEKAIEKARAREGGTRRRRHRRRQTARKH